jgi:hypothetical protein
MENTNKIIAGENIEEGDEIFIENDKVFKTEESQKLWEYMGYKSFNQCIKTIKKNIPTIINRTSFYHNQL